MKINNSPRFNLSLQKGVRNTRWFVFSAFTAFLTRFHRIQCISYKNSPTNLYPGLDISSGISNLTVIRRIFWRVNFSVERCFAAFVNHKMRLKMIVLGWFLLSDCVSISHQVHIIEGQLGDSSYCARKCLQTIFPDSLVNVVSPLRLLRSLAFVNQNSLEKIVVKIEKKCLACCLSQLEINFCGASLI